MRQLDGEAKKASANILKSLYESAASVKKQINTDKPEEAPKEEKEALIKKVQKPKVPHKEHIVEGVEETEPTESLRDKIAELQAYLDDTPEVPEDERASIQSQIDEILDEINYNENSLTEEVQVFDDEVSLDTVEDIYSVNEGIFAVINAALSELETEDMNEDKKSKLVDKLNTLKAENDKMRTLLNGYMNTLEESSLNESFNHINDVWKYLEQSRNEEDLKKRIGDIPSKFGVFTYEVVNNGEGAQVSNQYEEYDDLQEDEVYIDFLDSLEESSLNEAPNPENEEANKKIRDVMVKGPDSKFYKDVLNMGYNVEKDRYNKNSYIIVNPKKDSYRGNRTGKGSILSAYPDEDKNRGKRAISREGIKKMKADKRNAIDYKNALDKDYSPRSTGERLKFGSGKAPGTHYSNQFINDNVHSENTYDNYAQDTNLKYPNSGTEKIREFRRAKENTKIYEDPKYNYMYYRDMYRDAGDYNVNPKSYYDDKVKRAKEDLKDFQDSIADRILKLQSYIDDAKSERDKARKNYNNEKKKIKKLLKKESESQQLTEKINKDNIDINQKILKSLKSKRDARANEPELNKHGIKVNYNPSQGTTLTGKNGRVLSDDRKGVYGPSVPGFNNTHARFDDSYKYWAKDEASRAEEYALKLKQLQDMDRDDIIRKYNNKTTEEAMKAHQEDIERYKKWLEDAENRTKRYNKDYISSRKSTKLSRKTGHERDPRSRYSDPIRKDDVPERYNRETGKYEKNGMSSADKVDYLTYLTKKPTAYRTHNGDQYNYNKYNPAESMNKNIKDYRGLKYDIDSAKDHLEFQNKYYGVKSDEDLDREAEEIRAKAEQQIKSRREENEKNKLGTKEARNRVDNAEKAREDFMNKIRAQRNKK